MSLVNYEEIRQRNIEEYGKGTRHLAYLSDLYETRTHFLYELLQNAEDALAKRENQAEAGYVDIRLHKDCLELRHNGKPFDEKDVTGICGIGEGTKAGDYSQIGKFGIGFKSVYAYTLAPRIHSNREHFEVRRFVEPHALSDDTAPSNIRLNETCVVLPFDCQSETQTFRDYVPTGQAVKEIGVALQKLGLRTLLFLNFIREIRWSLPDGVQGAFQRSDPRTIENKPTARYVDITDGSTTETWLIFRRDTEVTVAEGKPLAVEVGFLLQGGKVIKANNTELVVSFPTTKRTELGFLIQGPFKTTKARDNIEDETKAKSNPQLIQSAAKLAADSLGDLCELGLLGTESFNALPLKASVFQDDNTRFFLPVYQEIREALKTKPLLPADGGGFVKAEEAKLARGRELVDLFSAQQLGILYNKTELKWLDRSITEKGPFSGFYAFLVGQKQGIEWLIEPVAEGVLVEPDALVTRLTAEFLKAQDVSWLINLMSLLQNSRSQIPDQ